MKKKEIIIIIILIIIIGNIFNFIYMFYSKPSIPKETFSEKKLQDNNKNPTITKQNNPQNKIKQNNISKKTQPDSESNSDSSSSSSSSTSEFECKTKKISYALKNSIKNSTCLEVEQGYCINKNVDCFLDVYNLDYNVNGEFILEFKLSEDQTQEIFDTKQIKDTINPRSNKTFKASFNIQSTGQEGSANKLYFCEYRTIEVPRKTIC